MLLLIHSGPRNNVRSTPQVPFFMLRSLALLSEYRHMQHLVDFHRRPIFWSALQYVDVLGIFLDEYERRDLTRSMDPPCENRCTLITPCHILWPILGNYSFHMSLASMS